MALIFCQISQARQSCDWPFRTSVQIQQNDFDGLSDYPVDLVLSAYTLHSQYDWSSNGRDLRIFSGDDTTPLPFTINTWNASSKLADVRVSFPTLDKGTRTIYLYYGNQSSSSASQAVPSLPFVNGKIKFHTRSNQNTDPDNLVEAKNLFNQGNDINTAYGCSHPDNFTGVTNRNQGTGRSNGSFVAYSKTRFTVDTAGTWGIRYGADFGFGGGLYIDKTNVLDEDWTPTGDFWWGGNWSSQYVLRGSILLTAGEHELEVIGAEDCCDGGVTVQFSKNFDGSNYDTATWLPFTADNIDIRSEACPIRTLTISYGSHDVCYQNIALLTSSSTTQYWTPGSTQEISLIIKNQESAQTVPTGSKIQFSLPNDISLSGTTGTNWNCDAIGQAVTCTYNNSISSSAQSSVLLISATLSTTPSTSSYVINPSVSANTPDNDTNDNAIVFAINVLDDTSNPASCTNPQPGLLAKFFNISGYSDTNIQNANEFQTLVNARANINYLMGQTIVTGINKASSTDGNPFDTATNDHFLLILEGYIYSETSRRNYYGVDGDDAVEVLVNGNVASGYYGLHGAAGSAQGTGNNVNLESGFTPIEFRLQENTGNDAYFLYWSSNKNNGYTIIPSNVYFHCAGNANIQLTSKVTVINDPINNTNNPKAIPGAVLQHTVFAENIGNISTDVNSTVLIQTIGDQSQLNVSNLSANGPVIFNDGSGQQASGLTYTFNNLSSNTDSLAFSTNGINFGYTPVADAEGYDANVMHICLTLPGTFKPTFNGITPTFNFVYQVKLD